ncbi:Acetyltransferase (GNAT) family protein [Labrenzia sp. THAF82]|uniref:GNAT family N-acetyltransferase n=1 Tax=Labrenzia sp. THAF82 TaxID=2587861 RepID=UPI001267CBAB|nr:GNAT family N-acetyltransferase [Labrenzia sp. THAF82]QFT30822.1 Acetyltransferase (GNAT) family protein [Labrenzia sp. THAF82]
MDNENTPVRVRPFLPGDLGTLLPLNNAAAPGVSALSAEAMLDLINSALINLVAEIDNAPVGLLLCMGDGADYSSPNYVWVSERFSNFAYIDRIFVDETLRGRKIGDALYAELFRHFAGTGRSFLCEVNERPPNPGSLRFHGRLGFQEVGKADHTNTAVIYMKRDPEPSPGEGAQ